MEILKGHDSEENGYILKMRDSKYSVDQDRRYWVKHDGEMAILYMQSYCLNRKEWLEGLEMQQCFRGKLVVISEDHVTLVGPNFPE